MKPDCTIDYYAVLGLQLTADEDAIKKAYRKLGERISGEACTGRAY